MKICLDPGHGGQDPGCIGVGGTREASVNLAFCLEAQPVLIRLGHTVLLTRMTDKNLANSAQQDLQVRCDMANQAKSDVFVSVHCNAPGRPEDAARAKGIEAYSLNCVALATHITRFMVAFTGSTLRGAFTNRRFYVLRKTWMPAALVEIGFLTHPGEGVSLTTRSQRARLIDGLAAGIEIWRKEVGK